MRWAESNEAYWQLQGHYQSESVPCRDPECVGEAEPEQDGAHLYYECVECGFSFGYEAVEETEGSCSLGLPEHVRRAGSEAVVVGTPVTLTKKP